MTPPSVGTPVVHRCKADHTMFDDPVIHVVLPPRRPGSTPLSDIRDAGFAVVAYGVFPNEIDGCDETGIRGEHVLIRRNLPL